MAGLGYVNIDNQVTYKNYSIPTDESCCGMLFDYGLRGNPFSNSPVAQAYLSDRQIAKLQSIEDAEDLGIDTQFMNGVPHYHISQFFEYAGEDSEIYVMFADCQNDFDAVQEFQQGTNGKLFQLGVWTEQRLWKIKSTTYGLTDLANRLQEQAEALGGRIGMVSEAVMPLSIILCCNTARLDGDMANNGNSVRYRSLPKAIDLNCPKVSVILGQNGTDEVHRMQSLNVGNCPVGFLGLAMACLYLASAEKSIGSVEKFNLNKNNTVNNAELGFGYLSSNISGNGYSPIENISKTRLDTISRLGYIVPTTYRGKEAEVFFSNDQTLSDGDYRLISLNRIMNKCRRIVRGVLLPYLNAPIQLTHQGYISDSYIASMSNAIYEKVDAIMIAKDTGDAQILGREIIIESEQNVIDNDGLSLSISIVPANISDVIEATETSGNENSNE